MRYRLILVPTLISAQAMSSWTSLGHWKQTEISIIALIKHSSERHRNPKVVIYSVHPLSEVPFHLSLIIRVFPLVMFPVSFFLHLPCCKFNSEWIVSYIWETRSRHPCVILGGLFTNSYIFHHSIFFWYSADMLSFELEQKVHQLVSVTPGFFFYRNNKPFCYGQILLGRLGMLPITLYPQRPYDHYRMRLCWTYKICCFSSRYMTF